MLLDSSFDDLIYIIIIIYLANLSLVPSSNLTNMNICFLDLQLLLSAILKTYCVSFLAAMFLEPECLPRSPLRCNSWRSGKSCVSIPRLKLHDPLYTRNALTNMLVQEIWLLVDDTSQCNYTRHLSHLNDGDSVAQARDFCPPSFHGQWVKRRQRNIGHRPQATSCDEPS